MKNHAKVLLALLALLLCGVIINVMTPTPAAANANLGVTVMNTPLPVAGTINANVAGTVGVNNFPGSIGVTNATDGSGNPIPVLTQSTSSARHLVTLQCSDHVIGPCASNMARINLDGSRSAFTIPSGQTLVITDITWSVTGCTGGFNCTIDLAVQQSNQTLPVVALGSLADSGGGALGSEHLTSGFAFSTIPVVLTRPGQQAVLTMTGYLTPAQ